MGGPNHGPDEAAFSEAIQSAKVKQAAVELLQKDGHLKAWLLGRNLVEGTQVTKSGRLKGWASRPHGYNGCVVNPRVNYPSCRSVRAYKTSHYSRY